MHSDHRQTQSSRPDQRPIGYWLKQLDRLIEESFERTLAEEHLTRRHWQVMNVLTAQPTDRAAVRAALAPFLADHPQSETALVDDLAGRGWATVEGDGRLRLSEAGRAARDELLTKITTTRRRTVQGITDEEYLATLDVLQRMAANLT